MKNNKLKKETKQSNRKVRKIKMLMNLTNEQFKIVMDLIKWPEFVEG